MEPTYANDPTLTPSREREGGKEQFEASISVNDETLSRYVSYTWQEDIGGIFVQCDFDPKIPVECYMGKGLAKFYQFIEGMKDEIRMQIQDRHSERIIQFDFKLA